MILFHQLAIQYFCEMGEFDDAEKHFDLLKTIHPDKSDEMVLEIQEMISEQREVYALIKAGGLGNLAAAFDLDDEDDEDEDEDDEEFDDDEDDFDDDKE